MLNGSIPHLYPGRMVGRLLVCGMDTSSHTVCQIFRHVGMVFQDPDAQLFNSTVEREIAYGLESLGLSRVEMRERIMWAAEEGGIEHLLPRSPNDLSGGEKQLVAVCAILALRPDILVLDEPCSSLDAANEAKVRLLVNRIRELGTTIILAEHRLQDIIEDTTRLMLLHEGRIALDGPPREIMREDLSFAGINIPETVRLFRGHGLKDVPLSPEDGAAILRSKGIGLNSTPLDRSKPPRSIVDQVRDDVVIRAEGLGCSLGGREVLRNLNLTVRAGEQIGLVGANGSGKTTLVKHLNGLLRPRHGRVQVMGRETKGVPVAELAHQVGIVFQNPNDQFFRSSVQEEIEVGPSRLGVRDREWCQFVYELFFLEPLLTRSPHKLSEGEKKRVAFASVLAGRPPVIVLDEPTTGQDGRFRDALGMVLGELRRLGHTIILVTHDLDFAETHTDRWIVLAGGRAIADGRPHEVMENEDLMTAASLAPTERFRLAKAMGLSYKGDLRLCL
jgi:energy-coupling factor transport system ATP-binding protein